MAGLAEQVRGDRAVHATAEGDRRAAAHRVEPPVAVAYRGAERAVQGVGRQLGRVTAGAG